MTPRDMIDRPYRVANRCGFTLIEILCVVVILGVIAAIAAPSLAPQDDLTVSAASRIVVADLLYAQSQAIATGSPKYVSFTAATSATAFGSYTLYSDAALAQPLTNPITQQPYTQNFGNGAASPFTNVALTGLSLNNPANTVLVFDGLGTPSVCPMSNTAAQTPLSAAGTISLQCGAMSVTMSIEPDTGNISVSSVQSQ